jgi:lysophospholipase L1-like esterase
MMISDYPWQIAEPDDPDVIRGWELTAQALERASRLATEQGAILAVIFLPSREQVYGPWIASQLPPGRTLAALASVENRLAALASAYNLPYFSLLAGLQEFARPNKLLYFAGDAHFNVAGNQAAAEVLFAWLQQQNWLPPAPSSP